MESVVKAIGDIFAFEVPLLCALFLGFVYIVAFFGAVYYGVDLCQKFNESVIGKPVKIILALTPIALIVYAPLLKFYPQQFISINATVGVLEIISLIYLMIWQSIYIFIELYLRTAIFIIRISFYLSAIGVGLLVIGVQNINYYYILIGVMVYRLYKIRNKILNNFSRIYKNFLFNIKCVVSI